MLEAYYRHRFLEIAGRYDEIFVPEMTVEKPVYHVHASGQHTKLEGQDELVPDVGGHQPGHFLRRKRAGGGCGQLHRLDLHLSPAGFRRK
jgi:hypothetical protein